MPLWREGEDCPERIWSSVTHHTCTQHMLTHPHFDTCVRIKADCSMKPLAGLEDFQSKVDFKTSSLQVNLVEGILKIQPERDLLKSSSTGRISLQLSHL